MADSGKDKKNLKYGKKKERTKKKETSGRSCSDVYLCGNICVQRCSAIADIWRI